MKDPLGFFCEQCASFLSSGYTLVESLEAIHMSFPQKKIPRVIRAIQRGESFSNACKVNPSFFSESFIRFMKAAEQGLLAESLQYYAVVQYQRMKWWRQIKKALTYPCIVFGVAILLVFGVLTFIVPTFESIFSGETMPIPPSVNFLFKLSRFLRQWGGMILLMLTIAIVILIRFFRHARFLDSFLWKIKTVQIYCMAESYRVLSLFLSMGLPLIDALQCTHPSLSNRIYRQKWIQIKTLCTQGHSFSQSNVKAHLPSQHIALLSCMEKQGKLDAGLQKSAEFYHEQIESRLEQWMTYIEPIMIIIVGIIIGGMMAILILPMIQISMAIGT